MTRIRYVGGCGCLACAAPGLFDGPRKSAEWRVCPPCYDHLKEHFRNETGQPNWTYGVGITYDKSVCLLEGTGCVACGMSHEAVRENLTSPPADPCDEEFMEDISS